MFHAVRASHQLSLKDAMQAVYACFLDQSFTMQIGLLLIRIEQPFAVSRLRTVATQHALTA
jgi:hypothetical protein